MKVRNSKYEDKKLVVSSNDLIHAKYTFTLWQKRVFTYMISQINMDDTDFGLQRMYVKELMDFFKVKNKDDYNVIQRIPEQLYEMSMKMPYSSEKGYKRWREIRILSQYTRPEDKEPDNAYVEMKFNDDLKPHLLELKKLFNQYDIRNIIHLRSVYSFKMYELIKSSEYLGRWEIGLSDLKEMLDVEGKYNHYGSFKLKILSQAQKDLTECCDVTFDFEEKTVRKRVEKLIFYIKKNQPTRNAKPPKMAEVGDKTPAPTPSAIVTTVNTDAFDQLFLTYYLQLKDYGISVSTLTVWLNTYPTPHIEACVKDFLDKAQKGKLRATDKAQQGGYLRTLIEQADFTQKLTIEKTKAETRLKENEKTQELNKVENAKKEQLKTQLAHETAIIAKIFIENPTLQSDILAQLNRRDGTNYAFDDIHKFPFLPSKIAVVVKQQFSERFN